LRKEDSEIERCAKMGLQIEREGGINPFQRETRALKLQKEIGKKVALIDIVDATFCDVNPTDAEVKGYMELMAYVYEGYLHSEENQKLKMQYDRVVNNAGNLLVRTGLTQYNADDWAKCISAYYWPFLQGARETLKKQEYLEKLEIRFEDNKSSDEDKKEITEQYKQMLTRCGMHGEFVKAYNELRISLNYMPKSAGEFDDWCYKSPNVAFERMEKCKELFRKFDVVMRTMGVKIQGTMDALEGKFIDCTKQQQKALTNPKDKVQEILAGFTSQQPQEDHTTASTKKIK
jgi:hypothetical protein